MPIINEINGPLLKVRIRAEICIEIIINGYQKLNPLFSSIL